jgi:hypothetical protein
MTPLPDVTDPRDRLRHLLRTEGIDPNVIDTAIHHWHTTGYTNLTDLADHLEHAQATSTVLAVCPTCASFWTGTRTHDTAWWTTETTCWSCNGRSPLNRTNATNDQPTLFDPAA